MLLVAAKGCSNNRVNLCLNEIVTTWGPYPSPASRHCAHFGKPAILAVPLAVQVENWGENRTLLKRSSCICTGLINQKPANIKLEQCPGLCVPAFCCILIFSFFVWTTSNTDRVLPQRLHENQITCGSCFICWGAGISRLCLELLGDAAEEIQIKVRCLIASHFLNR